MRNKNVLKITGLTIIICIIGASTTTVSGRVIKSDAQKDVKLQDPTNNAPWTAMCYWIGDLTVNIGDERNIPGDRGLLRNMNNLELSGSNSEVNIVVQADDYRMWGGPNGDNSTRRYFIKYDENIDKLANYTLNEDMWYLEEKNMGDPHNLIDFINWATTDYPAENYFLMLFSHGAGWIGMCQDESSGNTLDPDAIIDITELETALLSCVHLDVLFTYGCHMGQTEVYYELKDCADIILSGESTMGPGGDMIRNVFIELTSNPQMTPAELAQIFVDNYIYGIENNASPLFGIHSKDMVNIVKAVDNFAKAIIKQYKSAPLRTRLMLFTAFRHSTMILYFDKFNQKDPFAHELYEFAEKICDLTKNKVKCSMLYNAASEVLSVIDSSSILTRTENPNYFFHGMSIYSPPIKLIYRVTKNKYKLTDFAQDTSWDEFLNLYYFRSC